MGDVNFILNSDPTMPGLELRTSSPRGEGRKKTGLKMVYICNFSNFEVNH